MSEHPTSASASSRASSSSPGSRRSFATSTSTGTAPATRTGSTRADPVGSRLIFACDADVAMTSARPYRAALDDDQAVAELRGGGARKFDPEAIDALLDLSATAPPQVPTGRGREARGESAARAYGGFPAGLGTGRVTSVAE